MPIIEALPGRVILEFPPAQETRRASGVIIPQTSQRRIEFARLVHCGDATTPEEEIKRRAIHDAHARGLLFAISVQSGVPMYQIEIETSLQNPETYGKEKDQDLGHLNKLKSLRVYTIGQLHTVIDDPETRALFPEREP